MSSIDERVVAMEFDNKKFEDDVKTTMATLDNLEEKLQFEGAGKGLDELGKLGNNFTFGNLGDTIDDIGERFSTLGIIGMTALQNITNKAVDAGLEMAKALSVDQLSAGFSKYEENTSNIVALMNQLPEGEQSMESVEGYMKKLSWYSDATSFDLVAMTSALKKFAAQGMSAEQSIPIIMGIGNSITYAGVGAKEGSEAFGIFAKAIANGNLSLIQWKQLANRGIVTAQTKKDLMEAAVAEGTLVKIGEDLYKTNQGLEVSMKAFDSTLNAQKGKWVTQGVIERVFGGKYGTYTDVLSDYTLELQKQTGEVVALETAMENFEGEFGDLNDEMMFGKTALLSATEAKTFTEAIDAVKDAMSTQWMSVFQSIFGNAKEAKKLWTDVNTVLVDTFVPPVANLALLLAEWKELGGRNDLIEGFTNLGKAIKSVVGPIKEAFRNVFPAMSGKVLADATAGFKNFTEKLILSEEVGDKIRSVFEVVFQVFKAIGTVIGGIVKVGSKVVQILSPIIGLVFKLIGGAAQLIEKLADTIKNSEAYAKVLSKFHSIAESVKSAFLAIISVFENGEVATRAAEERGGKFYETFVKIRDKLKPIADTLASFFEKIGNSVKKAFNWNSDLSFIDNIKAKFSNLQKTLEPVTQKVKDLIDKIKIAISSLFSKDESSSEDNITDNATNSIVTFNNILSKIAGGIVKGVNIIFNALKKLFGKGGDSIDPNESLDLMGTFASKLERVKERFMGFVENLGKIFDTTNSGLLGLLLFRLSNLFASLKEVIDKGLKDLFKGADKYLKGSAIEKSGAGLLSFAKALAIVAAVAVVLSLIPVEKLGSGVKTVLIIGGFMVLLGKALNGIGTFNADVKTTLRSLSIAMISMALVVKIISKVPFLKGILAVAEMTVLLKSTAKALKMLDKVDTSKVSKLTIVGTTMLLFARAVRKLSGIPWPDALIGTGALVAILFSMAASMKILSKAGNVDKSANAMLKLSAAIAIMAVALKAMSKMENLDSALLGLVAALGSLVLGLTLISMVGENNNLVKAATAMVIMAAAMMLLVPSMLAFMNLEPEQIGMGLLAMAGAFAVIGIAGLVLGRVANPIFTLSTALLEVSIAIAIASVGMALLGPALALLATTFLAASPVILLAIKTLIAGIASLGADIAIAAASLIAALCTAIISSLDSIIVTIRAVLNAIGIAVLEFIPTAILIILTFVEILVRTIALTLDSLVDSAITLLLSFVIAVADGLRNNMNVIIYAFLDLLEMLVEAIVKAIAMLIPGVGDSLVKALDTDLFPKIRDKLSEAEGNLVPDDFLSGFTEGLDGGFISDALNSAGNFSLGETSLGQMLGFENGEKQASLFGDGIKSGLEGSLLDFSNVTSMLGETGIEGFTGVFNGEVGEELGGMFDTGLIEGLFGQEDELSEAGGHLGLSVKEGLEDEISSEGGMSFESIGKQVVSLLGNGVEESDSDLISKISKIISGSAESDDVKKSTKDFESVGEHIVSGLIKGMNSKNKDLDAAGGSLGSRVKAAAENTLRVKSPSRVFMQIGEYVDEGFAIGLTKYSGLAEKASAGVAESTVSAASKAAQSISKVMNSDDNSRPTISPVLDLTSIQNGKTTLDNLIIGRDMTASINSRISTDYDNVTVLASEISRLRSDIQDLADSAQLDPEELGAAVRSALSDMGIYMNRDRVGKLVTDYQNNTRRASGAY